MQFAGVGVGKADVQVGWIRSRSWPVRKISLN